MKHLAAKRAGGRNTGRTFFKRTQTSLRIKDSDALCLLNVPKWPKNGFMQVHTSTVGLCYLVTHKHSSPVCIEVNANSSPVTFTSYLSL